MRYAIKQAERVVLYELWRQQKLPPFSMRIAIRQNLFKYLTFAIHFLEQNKFLC